jgi:hypothetical protein
MPLIACSALAVTPPHPVITNITKPVVYENSVNGRRKMYAAGNQEVWYITSIEKLDDLDIQ